MTSKNSFWGSLKENNKRRIEVWLITITGYILILPMMTIAVINQANQRYTAMLIAYGEALAKELLTGSKLDAVKGVLGFSGVLPVITVIVAIVSAFQGFSWLYSRKKVDFYLGLPVKRSRRFWVIWINGVFTMLIPYAMGLGISLLIAAGNGACNGAVLIEVLTAYGVYGLMGLCVYHMMILAVMLTGNGVIAGLGFGVLCLYELMVRVVIDSYQQSFFRYKSRMFDSIEPIFSPFTMMSRFLDAHQSAQGGAGSYALWMVLFAIVVGALAWFCYQRRPAEAIGRALAYRRLESPLKILLVVPAALLTAIGVGDIWNLNFIESYGMSGDSAVPVIIALIISVVLLCALLQAIYEFDVRAIWHKVYQMGICGVLVILFFLFFRYDWAKYDAYVPAPEELESVAFIPDYHYYGNGRYGNVRLDENGNSISFVNLAERSMELKNTEDVCRLAKYSMEKYEKLIEDSYAGNGQEDTGRWIQTWLVYRLKSGRRIYRSVYINIEEEQTAQLLDRIMGTEEFQNCYFAGMGDGLEKQLAKAEDTISVSYTNRVYEQPMAKEELQDFIKEYRKDVAATNFSRLKNDIPVGVIELRIYRKLSIEATQTISSELRIQSFYENSIAWLKEHGYYMDIQLCPEDVERIQVCNYHLEIPQKEFVSYTVGASEGGVSMPYANDMAMAERVYTTDNSGYGAPDNRVYADYTEQEKILRIAQTAYPQELYEDNWLNERQQDNYLITVYFKSDSEVLKRFGNIARYCFADGQVPEFVEADTN